MDAITVKLKKLDEKAVVPQYAHIGDVGMDLTAIKVEYDVENDMYIYHTGLSFESDFNVGQFLFLRSSNCKKDAYLCNHVGIADSAIYRGEIQLRMKNRTSLETMAGIETMRRNINKGMFSTKDQYDDVLNEYKERAKGLEFAPYFEGDRIGQMVFLRYPTVNIEVVDELSETSRGEGGFGSTGN